MIETVIRSEVAVDALEHLMERRRKLLDWVQMEDTSREGAHEWKAEVLKGRLQEVEWAIEMLKR